MYHFGPCWLLSMIFQAWLDSVSDQVRYIFAYFGEAYIQILGSVAELKFFSGELWRRAHIFRPVKVSSTYLLRIFFSMWTFLDLWLQNVGTWTKNICHYCYKGSNHLYILYFTFLRRHRDWNRLWNIIFSKIDQEKYEKLFGIISNKLKLSEL